MLKPGALGRTPGRAPGSTKGRVVLPPRDPDAVVAATRQELAPVALAALILAVLALLVSASRGLMLLYGDAVAHLGIARRILDSRWPGLGQLGGVWLPLPHLLMLPFVQKMEWWQSGLAGAWPSLLCYIVSVIGCYKLARHMMPMTWAFAATAFFALNPNLLYLSTTAMTEPLFLALLLWSVVVTVEGVQALGHSKGAAVARSRMWIAGALTFAMVFTRYDGWIVGAVVWLVFAVAWWKSVEKVRAASRNAFLGLTLISLAGPLLWFWYNSHFAGDWLDFLRGPYSAAAIDKKTSPPGSKHYRGWHNPGWSLLFYTRTAQVDAAFWETGFAVMVAALVGAWMVWKRHLHRAALLLWVPLPFYVYSVAWGSVPIFIPQLYPHSFYNSRYGMEMLPALAIFGAFTVMVLERRVRAWKPKVAGWMLPVTLLFVAVNLVMMIRSTPLVLKEAQKNSATRIPFETSVAQQLRQAPAGTPILIDTSDHIGALQQAGIPLKQTLSPGDSDSFNRALKAPAESAALVVSFGDDAVAKSVAAHPQGLAEILVMCTSGQGCARFYRSDLYKGTR
ncbi:hypothetical protein AciPR4_0713 [Terriglobus saanensis SP1PR4]|uniref:Glycosyltransferase RgtA/B/C/D-like domain-containing protein n=2 Tax=Terriglobus saanensis TaxID=870903 RepID=E8V5L2_TERSS|nr:hypothetical protein AciPR4_0713 [Terriglobus saanensis SP1PR4]